MDRKAKENTMLLLTQEERRMNYHTAQNKRKYLNDVVKNAYAAWHADTDTSHETMINHMRWCRQAEHDRSMHEMFMAGMGWM